ncbi:MAG: ADP-ribosylglycohydrolase family protein [Nitrososphaerota archaeon]|nr:ADP-ribosylglycohydrolase family protein [Nitrososphaerota archaeon]
MNILRTLDSLQRSISLHKPCLLYSEDFSNAICKAVDCGRHTDCIDATVGTIWDVIRSRRWAPEKWMETLGDTITVVNGIANMHIRW